MYVLPRSLWILNQHGKPTCFSPLDTKIFSSMKSGRSRKYQPPQSPTIMTSPPIPLNQWDIFPVYPGLNTTELLWDQWWTRNLPTAASTRVECHNIAPPHTHTHTHTHTHMHTKNTRNILQRYDLQIHSGHLRIMAMTSRAHLLCEASA